MKREIEIRNLNHRNIVKYFDSWLEFPPPGWQEEEDKKWMEDLGVQLECYLSNSGEMGESSTATQETIQTSSTTKQPKYLYIQMELCRADNLADWLLNSDEYVQKTECLTIFRQIVEAVKYIHERGLIYRDLKVD